MYSVKLTNTHQYLIKIFTHEFLCTWSKDTCQLREPNLNFEFIYPGEGLEMLARVGLCGAVLDFRRYIISLRACKGLWASYHPLN